VSPHDPKDHETRLRPTAQAPAPARPATVKVGGAKPASARPASAPKPQAPSPSKPATPRPATASSAQELAGRTVPGVEMGDLLGRGGMAVVFSGYDQGFNPPRAVAVKFMSAELSADTDFRRRFEREASLVADFRHDHIVHVYSSGESQGAKFLVMEFLGGGSLADCLKRGGKMALDEALQVGRELADALAYSHARGVIHRDFKPGNVLFTSDRKPVLTDFGVAKADVPGEEALTGYRVVVGAPRYMAPEQAMAQPVTDRADVFSWGLTLYEMIAGRLPPEALQIQHGSPGDDVFHEQLPNAPAEVRKLIAQCLNAQPAKRPSALDCKQALVRMASMTAFQQHAAATSNRRGLYIGIAAALIAVAGGAAAFYWPRSEAVAPAAVATNPTPAAAQPASVVTSIAANHVPINARVTPEHALIYVDGQLLEGGTGKIAPGPHDLIVIAQGYYGEFHEIDVIAGKAFNRNLELEPTQHPPHTMLTQFLDLAEAPKLELANISDITEPALRAALTFKVHHTTGESTERDRLRDELETLSGAGDARASVASLLISGIHSNRLKKSLLTPEVVEASDKGDAMASFFVAVANRDALSNPEPGETSNELVFAEYCKRLGMAAQQGWHAVADEYRRRDKCPI
jgi:predicted Ser/Thr protein kinase